MKTYRLLFIVWLALALGACGSMPTNAEPTAVSSSTRAIPTPSVFVGQVANLSYTPTAMASPTQTLPSVTVTAVNGNLFIRRGPDLAYNAVSVLMDGQSAKAFARDVLGKWLQISLPDNPKETGWISIQSRFSDVSGEVMDLPEVMPTDWPVQASLRNCTYHQMEAYPGGIVVPSVASFPENSVQINPGVYTIHDVEVDGGPEVMEIEVKEGAAIDILDDGDGDHRKCPVP
ncbi:MAG: SH3 domain-containing protein [Chloroflexota bacterium]